MRVQLALIAMRMKIYLLGLLLCCATLSFAQDKWFSKYADMDDVTTQTAYGNDTITEHNVITLKQLREMPKYKNVLTQYRDYKLVDDDLQLKVRVTGNDIGGNIYNKVAVQDENGDAIFICVYSGGMFSYLPVGQELIINLKDLYIGTYGYQQQIGTPYTTSSGNTYPGRMAVSLWMKHFKLLGKPDTTAPNVQPVEFTSAIQKDMENNAGKLMTLKNVEIAAANGKATWAPENGSDFSISRTIKGYPSSVVVYTSTSAKFAAEVMPTGKVDITGIFSRYSTTWQIQLRTADDVKPAQ